MESRARSRFFASGSLHAPVVNSSRDSTPVHDADDAALWWTDVVTSTMRDSSFRAAFTEQLLLSKINEAKVKARR